MATHCFNDRNVYILGAGFSADAGPPLVRAFLNRSRDSVGWLKQAGRNREADAIGRVLEFRLRAAAAAYRVHVDLEDIEELFSLASATEGDSMTDDVKLAIAATLDYAQATTTPRPYNVIVEPSFKVPAHWAAPSAPRISTGSPKREYECPAYDVYVGVLARYFRHPVATGDDSDQPWDTFITFNYDTLIEEALFRLGIPHAYAFGKHSVEYDKEAICEHGPNQQYGLPVLKLHGSVNWAYPGAVGKKLTVFRNYEAVRTRKLTPLLVPPTWRKTFADQLSEVWDAAVAALTTATRIVIIGFSMPATDTHFKYLLGAGLSGNISLRSMLFVNPFAAKLERRLYEIMREEHGDSGIVCSVPQHVNTFIVDEANHKLMNRMVHSPFMTPYRP